MILKVTGLARTALLLMVAGALSFAVGCVGDPVAQAPTVEQPPGDQGNQPPVGGEGAQCASTASCQTNLRCLRQGDTQFCVMPCTAPAQCASNECNPIQGSTQGWCTPNTTPDPGNNDPAPDPGNNDPAPEPQPDVIPDPEPEAQPDPDPEPAPMLKQPGEGCDCDNNCSDIDGHSGICIRGVCMLEASGRCSSSGSRSECPNGARCWSGTGLSICYPDCGGFGECAGTCDGDNSCVSTGNMDCYQSCGTLCDRAGTPPNPGPGPGNDPDPDPQPDPNPDPGPMGDCGSAIESEEFQLTNQARSSSGLQGFQCDLALAEVARAHSEDMARRNYFSHTNPEGEQPWDRMRRAGINFRTAGENIAYGYSSADAVHTGWMNSSGHRANILSGNYTHMGVGAYNHNGTIYWTQVFAAY